MPADAAPRYRIVQEPVEGGVRSVLVISKAVENDFGLYNCSFTNAYGSDSAVIILQKQSKHERLHVVSDK